MDVMPYRKLSKLYRYPPIFIVEKLTLASTPSGVRYVSFFYPIKILVCVRGSVIA